MNDNHSHDAVKQPKGMAFHLSLPAAWLLAVISAIFPYLIVFNPGNIFGFDSFWGGFGLAVMVMTLLYFLVDAIVTRIRYKAVWIIFLLVCPSVTQIVYLVLRNKYLQE